MLVLGAVHCIHTCSKFSMTSLSFPVVPTRIPFKHQRRSSEDHKDWFAAANNIYPVDFPFHDLFYWLGLLAVIFTHQPEPTTQPFQLPHTEKTRCFKRVFNLRVHHVWCLTLRNQHVGDHTWWGQGALGPVRATSLERLLDQHKVCRNSVLVGSVGWFFLEKPKLDLPPKKGENQLDPSRQYIGPDCLSWDKTWWNFVVSNHWNFQPYLVKRKVLER